MYIDRSLAAGMRSRTARDHGVDILLEAWSGAPEDRRAARLAAQGDLARAASYARGLWGRLLEGEVGEVLGEARKSIGSPGMAFLEAEALFAAGAVVAGLRRLEDLHDRGDTTGTLGLVRRRHQLGDHLGAMRAAQALPWDAHAALTGARSALAADRPGIALRFVEPYLEGVANLPEPAVAGAFGMTVAAVLASLGEHAQLRRFADRLLGAGDLPDDMKPTVARAAWTAGLGREAWHRFDAEQGPWSVAARLELAVLAGDSELASRLLERAGPLGVPSAQAVRLLTGARTPPEAAADDARDARAAGEVFAEGRTVHIWRTHPHRWRPWIDAALRTPADVVLCDLAEGRLPEEDALPWVVMDDGALIDILDPLPVRPVAAGGRGATIAADLCRGVGIGHDWPDEETAAVQRALAAVEGADGVRVLGADEALAGAETGRLAVVVAPPGDPFWAGPLPELSWPALRVVRADPQAGWSGAGDRVAAAATELSRHPRSAHE